MNKKNPTLVPFAGLMRKVDLKLCKTCVKGSCCRHGVSACLFEVAVILKKNKHLKIKKPWFEYIGIDFEHTESGFDFETKVINGKCIFQDKRMRCRIYKTRPSACREFPHWKGKLSHDYDVLCHRRFNIQRTKRTEKSASKPAK